MGIRKRTPDILGKLLGGRSAAPDIPNTSDPPAPEISEASGGIFLKAGVDELPEHKTIPLENVLGPDDPAEPKRLIVILDTLKDDEWLCNILHWRRARQVAHGKLHSR